MKDKKLEAIKAAFIVATIKMKPIPIAEPHRDDLEEYIDRELYKMGQSEELVIELRDKIIEVAYASSISIGDLLCHIQRLISSSGAVRVRCIRFSEALKKTKDLPPIKKIPAYEYEKFVSGCWDIVDEPKENLSESKTLAPGKNYKNI